MVLHSVDSYPTYFHSDSATLLFPFMLMWILRISIPLVWILIPRTCDPAGLRFPMILNSIRQVSIVIPGMSIPLVLNPLHSDSGSA